MTRTEIEASNLKVILHSKRANIYYLEKCRVMQKDGRVFYLTEGKRENQYWNIPIADTTVLLLGTGTSITQAAIRMLSMAGVMVGFCGSGGTPLLSGVEIEWLSPKAGDSMQMTMIFSRLCIVSSGSSGKPWISNNCWPVRQSLRNRFINMRANTLICQILFAFMMLLREIRPISS